MTTKKPEDGAPTEAEIAEAKHDGVLDRVRESANLQDDPSVEGELPQGDRYIGKDEIMMWAHIVDYSLDALKAALDPEAASVIPDNKVAGLLGLERSGKNRTEFVQAYMDRLRVANPKLKSPYEVTDAGPDYTNDVTAVTKL